jgi:hypothetical protein
VPEVDLSAGQLGVQETDRPAGELGPAEADGGVDLVLVVSGLGLAIPRCELSAVRSFAVVGASQRPTEVPRSRSQSMTLLYSAAVRFPARPVRRCGVNGHAA